MKTVLNKSKFLRTLVFVLFVIFVFGCAAPQLDRRPVYEDQFKAGQSWHQIMVGNEQREYLIQIPSNYDEKSPFALLFDLHGSGGNPAGEIAYSNFVSLSEEKGFILVAPNGIYSERKSWNTTKDPKGVDDIRLVKEIINELTQELSIDPKRIYATGMSGGARMTSRLGCELSRTFAAIAPVAGIQFLNDCSPSRAMPVITFHGKKDRVNHYDLQEESPYYWVHGVEYSVSKWVKNNRCKGDPKIVQVSDGVKQLSWKNCRDGSEVIFYQIEDGGHTWPGSPIILKTFWSGKTNEDIVASELIWEFFMNHPLP